MVEGCVKFNRLVASLHVLVVNQLLSSHVKKDGLERKRRVLIIFWGFQFVAISSHLERAVSVYPLQIQHRVNVNDSKRNVAKKGEGERKNFQKGSRRLHRRSWKISQVS